MGKKYLDTKEGSLEQSILGVWQTAIEEGETRVDGRTKAYKEHRAKLEAARLRREKLVGGQKKLDKDKDGDIDAKDFAMLRKSAKKDKKEEVQIDELIGAVPAAVGGYVAGKIMSGKKHKKVKKENDQIDEILPAVAGVAARGLARVAAPAVAGYALGKENVKKKPGIKSKVIKAKKEEVEESYEIGTDEYRKHTEDVTPGENGEWAKHVGEKSQSMREALAKVWGVDEGKSPFKKEEKKENKTMTGKKIASVDINPTIKEKAK